MKRITDNDSWCGVHWCLEMGNDGACNACDAAACDAHIAWERLRQYERLGATPETLGRIAEILDVVLSEVACGACDCELHGDRCADGCFGCEIDKFLRTVRKIGGAANG